MADTQIEDVSKVHCIAHHRNGSGGVPFHVVMFSDEENQAMVATVFPEDGACAVLAVGHLAGGNIAFGENSWRGDRYEPQLRAAIAAWEEAR